jgi:hypothetical protein
MKYVELFENWLNEADGLSNEAWMINTDVQVKGPWQEDIELISLVWDFILDPEGDSLWFMQTQAEKIIQLARKYPSLREESLKYIKQKGGVLYRGLKDQDETDPIFDKNGNYQVGKYKSLDSFTVDQETGIQFSDNQYLIQVPLSEVESSVILSVDVLLNGLEVPVEHRQYWEELLNSNGQLASQHEVMLVAPFTINKKFIKVTDDDQRQVVDELLKFIKEEFGEKIGKLGPAEFAGWVNGVFIRMLAHTPGVLDLRYMDKEVTVKRSGEDLAKWIEILKIAIRDFIV